MSISFSSNVEAAKDALPVSEAEFSAMKAAIYEETKYGLLEGSIEHTELVRMIDERVPHIQSEYRTELFALLDRESSKRMRQERSQETQPDGRHAA